MQKGSAAKLAVALTMELAVDLAADREYHGLSTAGAQSNCWETTTAHTISWPWVSQDAPVRQIWCSPFEGEDHSIAIIWYWKVEAFF